MENLWKSFTPTSFVNAPFAFCDTVNGWVRPGNTNPGNEARIIFNVYLLNNEQRI